MENFLSLKDNLSMVKDELNAEEKFFENAVITERFISKYKKPLIGLASVIVVAILANVSYDYYTNFRAENANVALLQLQVHADDQKALQALKENNPKLYDLYMLSQAIKKSDVKTLESLKTSQAAEVSDIASYQLSSLQNSVNALNSYANTPDAINKDLALIESAVLLIQESKVDQADRKLASISAESPVYAVSKALLHYGVK
jgi:hypothetical protein